MSDLETPELDKQVAIIHAQRSPTDVLTEFYDWLQSQRLQLCVFETRDTEEPCPGFGMFDTSHECRNGTTWERRGFRDTWTNTGERHAKCHGTGWVTVEREDWWADNRPPEQLFADFFGIDRDKIEQERRALLDSLRST